LELKKKYIEFGCADQLYANLPSGRVKMIQAARERSNNILPFLHLKMEMMESINFIDRDWQLEERFEDSKESL
jgi:hypothetical protein